VGTSFAESDSEPRSTMSLEGQDTGASGWLVRERVPSSLVIAGLTGPVLMVALYGFLVVEDGWVASYGIELTVAIGVGLVVPSAAWMGLQTSARYPKRIRPNVGGVEVQTGFGKVRAIPWQSLTLSDARVRGFGVLTVQSPRSGFYVLSPMQYSSILAHQPRPSLEFGTALTLPATP
jgi:hypothetical protein